MGFWTKLEARARAANSLVCVGLDPHPGRLPAGYADVLAFNRAVIAATAEYATAYKPNIAFYEALGPAGIDALQATIRAVPGDIPVVLDAKRGDIATTATAYAQAVYDVLGADAMTLPPYLGRDSAAPFLERADRGLFVLCKTSNPSADELQELSVEGEPLYLRVARLAQAWGAGQPVGLVVGATYPEAVAAVRRVAPQAWFLVPGVGAQGGDLVATVRAGLRDDGLGLLINSSRGIIYAADPAAAARALRDQINAARGSDAARQAASGAQAGHSAAARLAELLFEIGCVQLGDFVLHSGAHSPIYVDLRRLVTYPRALAVVAGIYAGLLRGLDFQRIAAIPYAALPIGVAVGLRLGRPVIYPRREAKEYGTRRAIEGEFAAGERAVVLDDLISSGGSKLEAIAPLEAAGLVVKDVVVLIERGQGGREDLARHGYRLHAAVTLRELVGYLERAGRIGAEDAQRVYAYLGG